jgi:hypothetical protein
LGQNDPGWRQNLERISDKVSGTHNRLDPDPGRSGDLGSAGSGGVVQAELTWEWAAATGVGVGLVLLLIAIGYEQYREWKTTRYRDVER